MTTRIKYTQMQVTTLAGAGVSMGDTSMTLTNFRQINGTLLTMADFGTKGYGTNQPAEGQYEEQISFTGITQNGDGTATLTGISRVLDVSPYTETSGFAQDHVGGTAFVISNTAGFYNSFANKLNDEDITGVKWTVDDPTIARQIVNKEYVDNIAINGAVPATETVPGISMAANAADISNSNDQRPYNLEQYFLFVRPSQIYNIGARSFLAAAAISPFDAVYMKSYTPSGGILFDNKSVTNGSISVPPNTTGDFTYNLPFTVGSISNGMMLVTIFSFENPASTNNPSTINSAEFNGVPLTIVESIFQVANFSNLRINTYMLPSPAIGTHNLTVSIHAYTQGSPSTFLIPTAIYTYANCAQVTTPDAHSFNYQSNYPSAVTPTNSLTTTVNSAIVYSYNAGSISSPWTSGAPDNNAVTGSGVGMQTGDSGIIASASLHTVVGTSSAYAGIVTGSVSLAPANVATFGLDKASAATTATEFTFIGFAPIGGAQNSNVSVITTGYIDGFTSLIPGVRYFLSDTPGQISTTAGTVSKVVGIAVSPTTLLIENRN